MSGTSHRKAFAAMLACIPALGFTMPALAQTPAAASKPAFFVAWKDNPPGLTARPKLSGRTLPRYPEASIRAREEGVTELIVCVNIDGRLSDIRLTESSGHARLDEATLAWAAAATYSPATFQGEPMAVCNYPIAYEWRINQ